MPKRDRAAHIALVRRPMEAALGPVAGAINPAPDGEFIAGRECPVRDAFGALRRTAYAVGLPMRADAAEAAVPPSEERPGGGGTKFDRTAENLAAAAQVDASGETLRVRIEADGRHVREAFVGGNNNGTRFG